MSKVTHKVVDNETKRFNFGSYYDCEKIMEGKRSSVGYYTGRYDIVKLEPQEIAQYYEYNNNTVEEKKIEVESVELLIAIKMINNRTDKGYTLLVNEENHYFCIGEDFGYINIILRDFRNFNTDLEQTVGRVVGKFQDFSIIDFEYKLFTK